MSGSCFMCLDVCPCASADVLCARPCRDCLHDAGLEVVQYGLARGAAHPPADTCCRGRVRGEGPDKFQRLAAIESGPPPRSEFSGEAAHESWTLPTLEPALASYNVAMPHGLAAAAAKNSKGKERRGAMRGRTVDQESLSKGLT